MDETQLDCLTRYRNGGSPFRNEQDSMLLGPFLHCCWNVFAIRHKYRHRCRHRCRHKYRDKYRHDCRSSRKEAGIRRSGRQDKL
jgi:hypothetical protein